MQHSVCLLATISMDSGDNKEFILIHVLQRLHVPFYVTYHNYGTLAYDIRTVLDSDVVAAIDSDVVVAID